jgi:predicted CopG family antitoxin
MELLDQAHQARSMSNVIQLFTEYKKEEFVNIFSHLADEEKRKRVYDILSVANPSHSQSWDKIMK